MKWGFEKSRKQKSAFAENASTESKLVKCGPKVYLFLLLKFNISYLPRKNMYHENKKINLNKYVLKKIKCVIVHVDQIRSISFLIKRVTNVQFD